MTSMPQLQAMAWDFKEQLIMTQRQAVNASDTDGELHQAQRTYYVYDSNGRRVRKTTESSAGVKLKDRLYLGGSELYRKYTGGTITLECQTLHVMDNKKRIALVLTTTIDTSAAPTTLPRIARPICYTASTPVEPSHLNARRFMLWTTRSASPWF